MSHDCQVGSPARFSLLSVAVLAFSAVAFAQTAPTKLQFTVSITGPQSAYFVGSSFVNTVTETMTNNSTPETDTLSDFVVTKPFDASSPVLYQLTASGAKLSTVVISVLANVNGSTREMWRFTLYEATIKSVVSDSSQILNGLPSERVTFGYNKISRLDSWSGHETSYKDSAYSGN